MAWSDRQIIEALELADVQGLTAAQIAERMQGVSRNAVIGILNRVRRDLAESEAVPFPAGKGPASRPENRDGGMPAGWWRKRKAWA